MSTSQVLASIDEALAGWETGVDAARWHPDGTGPDELEDEPQGMRGLSPLLFIFDEIQVFLNSDRIDAMHALRELDGPRARCCYCNPAGNPEPLAIDGREYHRRQRARRRR